MKRLIGLGAIFLVLGCESSTQDPGNSKGLDVTIGKCQSAALLQKVHVDSMLKAKLIFAAKDSISFSLTMDLLCEADYSFSVSLISADTLLFAATDVGNDRSKCDCAKEITTRYKAQNGESLSGIKFVKYVKQVYELGIE